MSYRRKEANKSIWYTAHVVYRSDIHSRRARKLHTFEEVYFLVSAASKEEAQQKAKKIAKDKEHSYENMHGEQVSWRMARFEGVQEILDERLVEGTEVHSRFFRGLTPGKRR